MAMCSMRQSWLSVLIVLLLLPILRKKITQAQPSPQRINRHPPFPFSTWFWWPSVLVAEKEDKMSHKPPETVSHFQGLSAWGRNPVVWVAMLEGRQEILSLTQKYINNNQPSCLIPCQLLTGDVLCSLGLTGV